MGGAGSSCNVLTGAIHNSSGDHGTTTREAGIMVRQRVSYPDSRLTTLRVNPQVQTNRGPARSYTGEAYCQNVSDSGTAKTFLTVVASPVWLRPGPTKKLDLRIHSERGYILVRVWGLPLFSASLGRGSAQSSRAARGLP